MPSELFFSVIIPIYHVEEYLNQCVDSVLNQTFQNFEIILVDDGSKDRCPQICDEYKLKNPRVHVIHKDNGGLSEARNFGINAASGKYLLFLDSDDYWYSELALQHMHEEICKKNCESDLFIFQKIQLYPDGHTLADQWSYPSTLTSLSFKETLQHLISTDTFPGSVWIMAIKRDFLLDNNLYFRVGMKSEDIDWLLRAANMLPQCHFLNEALYVYRKGRPGSISNSPEYSYLVQVCELIIKRYMDYPYADNSVAHCLKSYVAYQFTILMGKAYLLDKAQRKAFLQELVSLKDILKYDLHPKVKQVNLAVKFCGFKNTCRLLGIYLKYRKR